MRRFILTLFLSRVELLLTSVEVGIVDHILQGKKEIELKDEVMKIKPVQKQTKAGQRTRFKAVVAVGDMAGHIGLGVKLAKEVQLAIRGALA